MKEQQSTGTGAQGRIEAAESGISTRALLPYSAVLRSLLGHATLPTSLSSEPTAIGDLYAWVQDDHILVGTSQEIIERQAIRPRTLAGQLVKDIFAEQPDPMPLRNMLERYDCMDTPGWMLPWERLGHYLSTKTPSGQRLWILSSKDAAREGMINDSHAQRQATLLLADQADPGAILNVDSLTLRGTTATLLTSRYMRDLAAMRTATIWAQESFDAKVKVGACILNGAGRVCGVGYNGRASGEAGGNLRENAGVGLSGYVHAEANALMHANLEGNDNVMYVTHEPCATCARLIISSRRFARVVYMDGYSEPERVKLDLPTGHELLSRSGIITERLNPLHLALSSSEIERSPHRAPLSDELRSYTSRR